MPSKNKTSISILPLKNILTFINSEDYVNDSLFIKNSESNNEIINSFKEEKADKLNSTKTAVLYLIYIYENTRLLSSKNCEYTNVTDSLNKIINSIYYNKKIDEKDFKQVIDFINNNDLSCMAPNTLRSLKMTICTYYEMKKDNNQHDKIFYEKIIHATFETTLGVNREFVIKIKEKLKSIRDQYFSPITTPPLTNQVSPKTNLAWDSTLFYLKVSKLNNCQKKKEAEPKHALPKQSEKYECAPLPWLEYLKPWFALFHPGG